MIKDARHIYQVSNEVALNRRWNEILAAQNKGRIFDQRIITPYINHSRWVADCPECNGGMGCWDEMQTSICMDCGHQYQLQWPENRATAVAILLLRPEAKRNWYPDEPLSRLEAENLLIGVE